MTVAGEHGEKATGDKRGHIVCKIVLSFWILTKVLQASKISLTELSHPGCGEWWPHHGLCWITSVLVVTFNEIGLQTRASEKEVSGSLE